MDQTIGPNRCLIVRATLDTAGADDHVVNDETVLVDATRAEALTHRVDAIAESGGARRANRQVEAEDVTRRVIDTQARVRAEQALAERLLTIIRSGNGKVCDLVQAERASRHHQRGVGGGERSARNWRGAGRCRK